jgi:hypothetical protein
LDQGTVVTRLADCERQVARLRTALCAAVGLLACVFALAITGFAHMGGRSDPKDVTITDSLRVRELIVVDGAGTVRARVGGNLPDPVYHGRQMHRGEQAAGLMLYDKDGLERGGYVTFDRSGVVGLTLDNRGQQVALFGADSTPGAGATARLWRGRDWVEMKVDQAGPHFGAGRDGALTFMQPEMSETDGQAVCSELKDEVARLRPAPPTSALLDACKSHAPDGICRKCLGLP